jgi:hypothetical protein
MVVGCGNFFLAITKLVVMPPIDFVAEKVVSHWRVFVVPVGFVLPLRFCCRRATS